MSEINRREIIDHIDRLALMLIAFIDIKPINPFRSNVIPCNIGKLNVFILILIYCGQATGKCVDKKCQVVRLL